MPTKLTTEGFIAKAISVHGNKYDYSQVNYINATTKIKIICPQHGEFLQKAANHTNQKQGCPNCGGSLPLNTEIFITRAKDIHGDKYDYSDTVYINANTKVKIFCKGHNGYFEQLPTSHIIAKQGCLTCSGSLKHTNETFIKKAKEVHGEKYDYSQVNYINNKTPVKIYCTYHKEFFEQTAGCHLKGQGCYKCGKFILEKEDFIKKAKEIHGDKYDYSRVKYVNATTQVIIGCSIHGWIKQYPRDHLMGSNCYQCGNNIMTLEQFVAKAKEVHGDKYDYSKVVYKGTTTKVIITCKKHGDFEQNSYMHIADKNGCPLCIHKTEAKLFEKLLPFYPELKSQFQVEWCRQKYYLPFDFVIQDHKIIIELDGKQHFEQVGNWTLPDDTIGRDIFKMKCANQNGYSIIRILQEDVWNDRYNWLKELLDNITILKNSNKVQNIFICKKNEYENHIKQLNNK